MTVQIISLIFLGMNAVNDILKRQIVMWTIPVYSLIAISHMFFKGIYIENILVMLVCFGLFGGICAMTKGAFGFGDVLVISVLSLLQEYRQFVVIICLSFGMAAIYSAFVILFGKGCRKKEIPFIPFLFLGYVGGLCI